LSLLNTPWYIQQLRDFAPRVPIRLTDQQVENLSLTHWSQRKKLALAVPPQVYAHWLGEIKRTHSLAETNSNPVMEFELGPTFYGQFLRIQDMMILHILAENNFRKPVYFAATVPPDNMVGLQAYLSMEGLAFRVIPVKSPTGIVVPEIMQAKLFEEFRYRNLTNPKVYFDDDSLALLTNYRTAFLRLAHHYQTKGENEMTLAVLDKMSALMPEEVVPPLDPNLSLAIGQPYHAAGRPEELKKRLKLMNPNDRQAVEPRQRLREILRRDSIVLRERANSR
jgi:hypothetical protein